MMSEPVLKLPREYACGPGGLFPFIYVHIQHAYFPIIPRDSFLLNCLDDFVERRDQRLREPEAKHQFRPRHQQLWCQALEEAGKPLVPRHVAENLEAALGVFKVPVLDPRLDHVQGG